LRNIHGDGAGSDDAPLIDIEEGVLELDAEG
jgi:hypothetical protein